MFDFKKEMNLFSRNIIIPIFSKKFVFKYNHNFLVVKYKKSTSFFYNMTEEVGDLEAHMELLTRCYLHDTIDILLIIDMDSMLYLDNDQERGERKEKMLHYLSMLEDHYAKIPFDELGSNPNLAGLYVIHKLMSDYDAVLQKFEKTGAKWLKDIDNLQSSLKDISELSGFSEYEWIETRRMLEDAGSSLESLSSDITPIFTILNALPKYKEIVKQFLREPSEELYKGTVRIWKAIDDISCEKLGKDLNAQAQRTLIAIGKWFIRVNEDPIKKLYEELDTLKSVIMAVPPAGLYESVDELRKPIKDISFEGHGFDFAPLFIVRDLLPKYRQKIEQFFENPSADLRQDIFSLRKLIGYVHSEFYTSENSLMLDSTTIRNAFVSRV